MFKIIKHIADINKDYFYYFIISVILGISLGLVEISFVYSLKEALHHYDIIEFSKKWEFSLIDPVYLFLFFALLRLLVSALTYFWQLYLGGLFKYFVKKNVISFLYSESIRLRIGIKDTSNLLTNISDKGSFCFHHLSSLLSQSFLIFINLIFLLLINFKLFLICGFILLFLATPIYFSSRKLNSYAEIFKKSNTNFINKIFLDSRNILFLKISGALKKTSLLQMELNNSALKSQKNYSFKYSFLGQIPFFFAVIILFIILFVNKNYLNIDNGTLIVFIFLFFRICISAGNIITSQGNVKFHFPFLVEYKKIIENLNDVKNNKNGDKKINPESLNTRNLIIERGNLKKNIPDISIEEGQLFSILGSSGTGKSTLILTLFGILKNSKGQINWNNTNLEEIDIDDFYKKVSFCGTDPFLIKGTLDENLFYGLNSENSKEDLNKLIEICDAEFIKKIEKNQKILDDEGTNFSSGQRQKIALIRALIKKPKVLILDEATSNIDLNSEKEIIENIFKEYPKIIIIATTHRPGILMSKNCIHLY